MKNFRNPADNSRSRQSVDGLLPNNQKSFSKKRFSDNYVSKKSQRVDRETGFVRRDSSRGQRKLDDINSPLMAKNAVGQQDQEVSNFVGINDVKKKPQKKKRGLFRRRKEKNKLTPFKKVRRAFAIFLMIGLIGFGGLAAYTYIKTKGIFKGDGTGAAALNENVDPSLLNGEGDGRVNLLLLGKGGEGHEAPDLTDTILLASIDPIKEEATLVSIPRDLYVLNEDGNRMKINAVYSTAKQKSLAQSGDNESNRELAEREGINALEEIVSEVLGVPIHYYTMVDFTSFEEAIDTVGGITIDVKEPLVDYTVAWELGGNPVIAEEGLQTFDGKRALFYARSRKGSARGDFDRTARQQEVIVALQQKILSAGTFSNPIKVVELLTTLGNHVRTDLNGLSEIKRLYEIGGNISGGDVQTLGLADEPNVLVRTGMIDGVSVVYPTEGLDKYGDIQSFIRNRLKDSFLADEDARIIILNGTNVPGLASRTEKELESYGYNVIKVDNAPTSDYVNNMIIDNTNGAKPYTESYLEKRLRLTTTTTSREGLPGSEEADFVIILGTDEISQTSN